MIIETLEERGRSPAQIPAVRYILTARSPGEKMPPMQCITRGAGRVRLYGPVLAPACAATPAMQNELLDKHYLRKHGANAITGSNPSRRGFIAPALRIDCSLL